MPQKVIFIVARPLRGEGATKKKELFLSSKKNPKNVATKLEEGGGDKALVAEPLFCGFPEMFL